ncbi:MAG: efflux RND transporter periplasmic adaptor subunit [Betaproteobacteria bacterium]|nr:MAG: efflux RND transporter periplasmic adaptor subunit [Betaproteobacteria bacterium]
MYKRRGSLLVLGALASSLLLAACGSEPEVGNQAVKPVQTAAAPPKPMGLPVKAEPVKVGAVIDEVTAVGSLLAEESVIIRPEIDGRIVSLNFREGQSVKRGQRLLTLDSSEWKAQLAAVKAELRTEQQRHQRARELYEQKFITKEALDIQAGAVDRLEARVTEAQVRVDKTIVRAPFSGVVGLREVSPGAYVKAGDDIVILENLSSIKVDFRIPEVHLGKISREQPVALRLDAFPGEEFQGRVYAIQPAVDEETRTVLMRARVSNKGFRLKPGMFVRVAMTMSTRPNAITVPEQALWPQGKDNFVFKVVDGRAMLTKVELGNRRPGEVEINQGLAPGDVVVTEGQIKLRDGAPVMVMGVPPASGNSTAQDGGSRSG